MRAPVQAQRMMQWLRRKKKSAAVVPAEDIMPDTTVAAGEIGARRGAKGTTAKVDSGTFFRIVSESSDDPISRARSLQSTAASTFANPFPRDTINNQDTILGTDDESDEQAARADRRLDQSTFISCPEGYDFASDALLSVDFPDVVETTESSPKADEAISEVVVTGACADSTENFDLAYSEADSLSEGEDAEDVDDELFHIEGIDAAYSLESSQSDVPHLMPDSVGLPPLAPNSLDDDDEFAQGPFDGVWVLSNPTPDTSSWLYRLTISGDSVVDAEGIEVHLVYVSESWYLCGGKLRPLGNGIARLGKSGKVQVFVREDIRSE